MSPHVNKGDDKLNCIICVRSVFLVYVKLINMFKLTHASSVQLQTSKSRNYLNMNILVKIREKLLRNIVLNINEIFTTGH